MGEIHSGSASTSLNSTLSRSNIEINTEDSLLFKSSPRGCRSKITVNGDLSENLVPASTNLQENSSDDVSNEDRPPQPPPRPKKKNRMKVKNLSLNEENFALSENFHQNDFLFRTDSTLQLRKENNFLKGNINVLVLTAGGLRH